MYSVTLQHGHKRRHSAHVCSSSLTLFSWHTLKEHIKKLLSPSARQQKPRTSLNLLKKKKDAKSSRSFSSWRPLEEIKCKKTEWEEPMSFFLLKLIYGSHWRFFSSDDFRATAAERNTSVQRTLWTTCDVWGQSTQKTSEQTACLWPRGGESHLFLS